ncbi:carbohydrate ABC transporter permease [Alicyclobacillus kakegawensis]|uniref:carbohydrate ABC transporter permease n=1 Tax=Alicyclobacillus kakegawensis TaxID=392012 RepID=UPI00082D2F48|nr:sugar ABC transporter permease [Alicyclobacillus kakegawensis]
MHKYSWLEKKPNLIVLWMLLPALVLELLIHILPMLVGLYISFTHLTTFTLHDWLHAPFIGLENYKVGLNPSNPLGAAFFWSFFISLAYTAITVIASTLLGLGGALLVNHHFPGRAVFRTIFLLPYAMPVFVVGIVWRFMFMRDWGLVNQLLVNAFHVIASKPFWLIGPHAFIAIVIASIWRNWPFLFLISLAGLQTIPPDQYEAAEVDGANTLMKFRHITLPGLRPVISIGILLSFLWTFNDFTLPFSMLGENPSPSADVLTLHIYSNSFQDWNFGTGAAMSVLMMMALGLIILLFNRMFRLGRRNEL